MGVAVALSISLRGAEGHLIEVQADVSRGMVGTALVGRLDASVTEARDRVRMAVNNSSPSWPSTKRVTILLAPADLPKMGTHFDLAIAVAVKAADQTGEAPVPVASLADTVFIGELGLSGSLRPVSGVLPMVIAAAAAGVRRVFVPETQAHEAALVPGMAVFGMRSLAQVVAELRGEEVPDAPAVSASTSRRLLTWRGESLRDEVDMADVEGMEDARYSVEVAAAGGHHLLLTGPRGTGKTTLAERIPTILPDLTVEQALEVTAVRSLAGTLVEGEGLLRRPPFLAPHHDASRASILGGGTGSVRPGAVSQAHHGVLFLDEFPLLRADVVDALRQPLESGEVTLARGEETATYPARGMVVLAANPCPCGKYHPQVRHNGCDCLETARRHHQMKLQGPMADRIDIQRRLDPQPAHAGRDPFARRDDSATVRQRVARARERQARRFAGRGWMLNSGVPGPVLVAEWPLDREGRTLLDAAVGSGTLSRRGATRVHRVAWTVADLAGHDAPDRGDVEVALALRTGDPLPARVLEVMP